MAKEIPLELDGFKTEIEDSQRYDTAEIGEIVDEFETGQRKIIILGEPDNDDAGFFAYVDGVHYLVRASAEIINPAYTGNFAVYMITEMDEGRDHLRMVPLRPDEKQQIYEGLCSVVQEYFEGLEQKHGI